jgi:hypothetical protein
VYNEEDVFIVIKKIQIKGNGIVKRYIKEITEDKKKKWENSNKVGFLHVVYFFFLFVSFFCFSLLGLLVEKGNNIIKLRHRDGFQNE